MVVRVRSWLVWGASVLSLMLLASALIPNALMPSASGQKIVSSSPVVTTQATVSGTTANSYYCAKCGTYHTRSGGASQSSTSLSSPVIQTSGSSLSSSGGTSNVLSALNAQRARQGLGSLAMHSQLQAVAEQRAQLMASTGTKSHPPGSFSPGRYEGVGWSSSYSASGVSACFTSDPNMRVAGAAMATGRDGVYFCVVYR